MSLASAVLLCLALGAIIWESIARLTAPAATSGRTIVVVAGIGVVINLVTAVMFMSGRHSDLNIKSAFLHMAADAVVSLGVLRYSSMHGRCATVWPLPATHSSNSRRYAVPIPSCGPTSRYTA